MLRRLISIFTGLGAALLALRLISRYNKKVELEGEYRVLEPELKKEKNSEEESSAEENEQ